MIDRRQFVTTVSASLAMMPFVSKAAAALSERDFEPVTVKWFNRLRGFGFVTRGEGSPDIFVHKETLEKFGFKELRPGAIYHVRYGMGCDGFMVSEIKRDANDS